jgi:phosphoglycolate phosphatase/AHBA synthesis associated protein
MRAVLFDLDGVLIDSREVWFYLMQAAAKHFGQAEISRQAFLDSFGQGVDADLVSFYPGIRFQDLDEYYDDHFRDHRHHFQINPDASMVLEELRHRGIPVAVVTNTSTPLAGEILGWTGLKPDFLVGSSDVKQAKPAPDMVYRALELLEVPPEEALFVGDSPYDREAAAAAGVSFAGYGGITGDRTLARLHELLEEV